MGMAADITMATLANRSMHPGSITIYIAPSSATAPASATATLIGGTAISTATDIGRRAAIRIDQVAPRGAPMMTSAPTMHRDAPIASQRSGGGPSIAHSQTSDATM